MLCCGLRDRGHSRFSGIALRFSHLRKPLQGPFASFELDVVSGLLDAAASRSQFGSERTRRVLETEPRVCIRCRCVVR